jgi:molybdopterin molybdotransferase
VCFEVFVRPAVRALQGERDPRPRYVAGELAAAVRRNAERDEFVRARTNLADGRILLEPVSGQESHMIARAAAADALVLAPRGEGELAPGSTVRFLPLT